MSLRKRFAFSLVFFILFSLFATVVHHHDDGEDHHECPICVAAAHHHAAGPSASTTDGAPFLAETTADALTIRFVENLVIALVKSRAPPA